MEKLNPNQPVAIPLALHPLFRTHLAAQRGVEKNLLFSTWGGIGDVICSEPTVRYALENFKDCKITVATHHPEIFQHLKLHDVYDLKKENPIQDDYLVLHTIPNQDNSSLIPLFISHMITNCVDFPSLSAMRMQLPIKDREVILKPEPPQNKKIFKIFAERKNHVVIHAGRHWASKTFPSDWWNSVIESIKQEGLIPVLIGKHDGESQGYVDTTAEGCVDLRDKTSLNDSIWLVQNSPVVVCNDSSPLHMAATGDAWILFIASVKHPDYITHYRKGVFGWRMQNLSVGGLWDITPACPNTTADVLIDKIPEEKIRSILPSPEIFGRLCREKINDYFG